MSLYDFETIGQVVLETIFEDFSPKIKKELIKYILTKFDVNPADGIWQDENVDFKVNYLNLSFEGHSRSKLTTPKETS